MEIFFFIIFSFFLGEKKVCWGRLALSFPKTGDRSSREDNGSVSKAALCAFRGMPGTSHPCAERRHRSRVLFRDGKPAVNSPPGRSPGRSGGGSATGRALPAAALSARVRLLPTAGPGRPAVDRENKIITIKKKIKPKKSEGKWGFLAIAPRVVAGGDARCRAGLLAGVMRSRAGRGAGRSVPARGRGAAGC